MIIAYLVNQYPQTSQTAIRRELAALEKLGLTIHRFTLRSFDGGLADEDDREERRRTRVVLGAGPTGLLGALLRTSLSRPRAFLNALRLALSTGRSSEKGVFTHLVYLAEACVLRRWLTDCRAEHLHAHYATNSAAVAMLCRVLGGPPYSFTMHGPEEFDSPRALRLKDKIRHAEFVVAICEFTRSQLYRWADYRDWAKVRIVHCGVGADFLDHERIPISDVPRLVNIGRIAEQKGQVILVLAAARLLEWGLDFEIVIVGDGPMRGEIEHLIASHGLSGRIRITGYLSNAEVRRELIASRALVLPSFAEGLPGVFFEAFALRRPVISTYIAGHPELVEPGVNGWLVAAGSVDSLADAMREALQAPVEILNKMGNAGADRVSEQHNAMIEASKLNELMASDGGHEDTAIDEQRRISLSPD
jgi:colanic acid/amylovoran biosynthesis glycosyltransferase